MVKRIIIGLLVGCMFCRCTPTLPTFEEMVGTWQAQDSAIIELKSDSTFYIKNYNSYFFHSLNDPSIRYNEVVKYKVDARGTWRLKGEYNGLLILYMGIETAVKSQDSLSFEDDEKWIIRLTGEQFYIRGEHGIFTHKPPWFIRVIDDFDDYTIYDFLRVE